MKMSDERLCWLALLLLLLLLLLAGCAAPAPPPLPPPAAPEPARPEPALPKPVASVVRQYERAARKELVAVTQPSVTVEAVHQVHAADLEARLAMDALGRQRRRVSPAALARAQGAVRRLDGILAAIMHANE